MRQTILSITHKIQTNTKIHTHTFVPVSRQQQQNKTATEENKQQILCIRFCSNVLGKCYEIKIWKSRKKYATVLCFSSFFYIPTHPSIASSLLFGHPTDTPTTTARNITFTE